MPSPIPSIENRCRNLNLKEIRKGDYVLYWMQQSQRTEYNHALEKAIVLGNQLGLPVVTVFGLTAGYPEANLRHYRFMLEGLAGIRDQFHRRGVKFVIRLDAPHRAAIDLAEKASAVVCDRGYLRHQAEWRREVVRHATCRVI